MMGVADFVFVAVVAVAAAAVAALAAGVAASAGKWLETFAQRPSMLTLGSCWRRRRILRLGSRAEETGMTERATRTTLTERHMMRMRSATEPEDPSQAGPSDPAPPSAT